MEERTADADIAEGVIGHKVDFELSSALCPGLEMILTGILPI